MPPHWQLPSSFLLVGVNDLGRGFQLRDSWLSGSSVYYYLHWHLGGGSRTSVLGFSFLSEVVIQLCTACVPAQMSIWTVPRYEPWKISRLECPQVMIWYLHYICWLAGKSGNPCNTFKQPWSQLSTKFKGFDYFPTTDSPNLSLESSGDSRNTSSPTSCTSGWTSGCLSGLFGLRRRIQTPSIVPFAIDCLTARHSTEISYLKLWHHEFWSPRRWFSELQAYTVSCEPIVRTRAWRSFLRQPLQHGTVFLFAFTSCFFWLHDLNKIANQFIGWLGLSAAVSLSTTKVW